MRGAIGVGLALGAVVAGCGSDPAPESAPPEGTGSTVAIGPAVDPGDGGVYAPEIDPGEFSDQIDNPYLPLSVGSRWVYEGESDGEVERTEVVVTGERRQVMGVTTLVVRDTVTVDGELVEDTYDWFAQDAQGNVWYFGEVSQDYEDGQVVSTAGSWEAGVGGALPGIVMLAAPEAGEAYRQEFLRGEAEDMAEVVEVGATYDGPVGASDDAVVTRDWNPLEPDVIEHKTYVPEIGLVYEEKVAGDEGWVELVSYEPGA